MNIRELPILLKTAFKQWRSDNVPVLGAAIAYYAIFSIAPLLIVAIAIAGYLYGAAAVQGQVVHQIEGYVGTEAAKAMEAMLRSAYSRKAGLTATVIGLAALFLGASSVFVQLQATLNRIWNAPEKVSVHSYFRQRLVSFFMVLIVGLVLLAMLVLNTLVASLAGFSQEIVPVPQVVIQTVNLAVSFFVLSTLFALIYKTLPDAKIRLADAFVGGGFTALFFLVGQYLISLYLARSSAASMYGAAGSVLVLLLWVYYSVQIFFFGAEFTQAYAGRGAVRKEPVEQKGEDSMNREQAAERVAREKEIALARLKFQYLNLPQTLKTVARIKPWAYHYPLSTVAFVLGTGAALGTAAGRLGRQERRQPRKEEVQETHAGLLQRLLGFTAGSALSFMRSNSLHYLKDHLLKEMPREQHEDLI